MNGAIEIRPGCPEDAPEIARLARETWWDAYAAIIPHAQIGFMLADRYDDARLRADMTNPEKWMDLAFCDGHFAGFAASE
ncbi:MAG: N-acetyltransferase, partial [Zoogloeaceae bacterium]|nr:N-acetyltransferase [Zoogloeaceae bacterium]